MIYYNGKEPTPKLNGVDLSKVMYNGKQIWPEIVTEIALADTKAGDVLLWDKINQKKLFTSSDNLSSYPAESYTPIGVVVIPASHNVYGDGSCGVMSLKEMNYDSPDTGSTSYQGVCWGQYGRDLSLSNLTQAPTGNTEDGIPTGQAAEPRLPSDIFSGTQCLHDTDAYYYGTPYAPSPYLTDGSRNHGYYQTTSPSSTNNCLSDFDGIGNSKILWDNATSQGDWKTASTITNNSNPGYSPAACCCWRYHTEGTRQGDWYLPACGELGYIMPPFNKINEAITKMRNAYGSSVGVQLGTYGGYWSSSEYSGNYARYVSTSYGTVYYYGKNNYNYFVRAFLKVSPLDLSGMSTVSLSCVDCTFEDGSTDKNETVQTGTIYTLPTIIPDERYVFNGWSKDGSSFSKEQNAQALIEADCYFQATCIYTGSGGPVPGE